MYGETMFKRLWHSGYKGRFAVFTWPTFVGEFTFNDSEYRAWKCGESLKQYVNSLPAGYARNLAAHSMGNIVAGEAVRLGASLRNYALLNAALPAMCYDHNAALEQWNFTTPNKDPDLGTRALAYVDRFANNFGVRRINFALTQDRATTTAWQGNNFLKPESSAGAYFYDYTPTAQAGQRLRISFLGLSPARFLIDPHESMSYACQSLTRAVGAEPATGGFEAVVVMDVYGFDREHSAQFIWTLNVTQPFYQRLLQELQ